MPNYFIKKSFSGKSMLHEDYEEAHMTFWESVLKAYQDITVKFEEIKEFGNLDDMRTFEQNVITVFIEKILGTGYQEGIIDTIFNDEHKPHYGEDIQNIRDYMGRSLDKEEYLYAKKLLEKQELYFQKLMKYNIYELYCKTLRRCGNYYKNDEQWYLALKCYRLIEDYGFKGINDGKNMIKCRKEILLLENKQLQSS